MVPVESILLSFLEVFLKVSRFRKTVLFFSMKGQLIRSLRAGRAGVTGTNPWNMALMSVLGRLTGSMQR